MIKAPEQVRTHWQRVTKMLAFLLIPQEHWDKVWGPKPLKHLNVAPRCALGSAVFKRRTKVDGILPNDAAIFRLVVAQQLEQKEGR